MENLIYSNEFLKRLEPFIVKNDLAAIQKIKEALGLISNEKAESVKLQNIKTKSKEDIFMTALSIKKAEYNLFWVARGEQKILITLTKGNENNFCDKL